MSGEKTVNGVLADLKNRFEKFDASDKIDLSRKTVREQGLVNKIGVYAIYDKNGAGPLYVGSSKNLDHRLVHNLFNPKSHYFTFRLLKEKTDWGRKTQPASQKKLPKTRDNLEYKAAKEEVKGLLESYQLRLHAMNSGGARESLLAKALLLEAFTVVVLEPEYNMMALREKEKS